MLIRYSEDPKYPEIEIELLDQDFEEIQSKLLEDNAEVFCQETSKSPVPYSHYLSSIKVHIIAEKPVEFKVDLDKLLVSGDLSKLALLAENIGLQDTPFGYHVHIEYFEDHFYIGQNSIPIVVIHGPYSQNALLQ
jgi:hypothetical protein